MTEARKQSWQAFHVLAETSEAPPFELRRPTLQAQLPTLLDHAAVAQRYPRRRAVARIAAASVAGFRSTLDAAGFTEIHTPKLVSTATESRIPTVPAPRTASICSSAGRSW